MIFTHNSPVQRKQTYAWNVELLSTLNVTSHPESFSDSTFVQDSMGKIYFVVFRTAVLQRVTVDSIYDSTVL